MIAQTRSDTPGYFPLHPLHALTLGVQSLWFPLDSKPMDMGTGLMSLSLSPHPHNFEENM